MNKPMILVGTIFTVTQSSMADTHRYAMINVYGHLNNDQGRLLYKDVTIGNGDHVLHNMGAFTSNVIGGDSGGPIIYHDNGTNKLIGSLHGKVCFLDNIPSRSVIDKLLDFFRCHADPQPKYEIFTSWEHIKTKFKIR